MGDWALLQEDLQKIEAFLRFIRFQIFLFDNGWPNGRTNGQAENIKKIMPPAILD